MKKIILIVLLLFAMGSFCLAQNHNARYIGEKQLYYGVAYYPEVWKKNDISSDIQYMKDLKMNVVRMAEFSWALMEPEEGVYEFEWLHKIIDELHRNGISVILGTPTAAPPIWMATKYPDIFITDENGIRAEHGARRNCRYTSKIYQQKSVEICEAMAKEFGRKPGVIAWQTDNEFGLSIDYSIETGQLWHKWLEAKYETVEQLNDLWCLNLWSQKYDRFDQVPLPKNNIWHHPSLRLDWLYFCEDQLIHYQDLQLKALRKYSQLPITHDGMPGQQIDYPRLFKNLDFATTNAYHSFQVYNRVQSNYDRLRGYGMGMHWLFETAPNHSGGGPKGNTWFVHQPEGSMRAAIWMNYALGGQGSLFWLWRQQPAGQEMPHGAILSAWGKPFANYTDLKVLGQEISRLTDFMMDNPVSKAEVAIVYDHNSDKALRIEEISNGIKYYTDWTAHFYRPLSDAFIHRDVIPLSADFSRYKLIFMPLLPVIPGYVRERIMKWVENGGILMLGPMSGYRNEYFAANTDFALGNLEPWMGIEVNSRLPIDPFTRDHADISEISFSNGSDTSNYNAHFWTESLTSTTGKVVATHVNGMHHGKPAIIENKVGKGKVVLLGSSPGAMALQTLILDYCRQVGIEPMATGDQDILMVPRGKGRAQHYFIINLKNQQQELMLPFEEWEDLMNDTIGESKEIKLDPYQIMLIKQMF